ncbi:MAG: hypothetical protein GY827_04420 [Cytophagales bacterium]|nr:hypothetical protein [Cytophagales bacterium]
MDRPVQQVVGKRQYELSNHLGNVLATVSDRKVGIDTDANGTVNFYDAEVISLQDYYPFGMAIAARSFQAHKYKYGFNGAEKDDEVSGEGNSYTTHFRQYDPRVGRWLSLDPKMNQYPELSAYVSFKNSPIFYTDPFGDAPPQDFTQYTSVGGGNIYIHQDATVQTNGNGEVTSFNIGKRTYSYNQNNQQYETGSGQIYNPFPDITVQVGGNAREIAGTGMQDTDLNFTVTGLSGADNLQIVQIVYTPFDNRLSAYWNDMEKNYNQQIRREPRVVRQVEFNSSPRDPDIRVMGKLQKRFNTNNQFVFSEIDAGLYSSWTLFSGRGGASINPNGPYYKPNSSSLSNGNGTINFFDRPLDALKLNSLRFTTMIVATNYMDTGRDVMLATFNWSYMSINAPVGNGGQVLQQVQSTLLFNQVPSFTSPVRQDFQTLNYYYPNYNLFGY